MIGPYRQNARVAATTRQERSFAYRFITRLRRRFVLWRYGRFLDRYPWRCLVCSRRALCLIEPHRHYDIGAVDFHNPCGHDQYDYVPHALYGPEYSFKD